MARRLNTDNFMTTHITSIMSDSNATNGGFRHLSRGEMVLRIASPALLLVAILWLYCIRPTVRRHASVRDNNTESQQQESPEELQAKRERIEKALIVKKVVLERASSSGGDDDDDDEAIESRRTYSSVLSAMRLPFTTKRERKSNVVDDGSLCQAEEGTVTTPASNETKVVPSPAENDEPKDAKEEPDKPRVQSRPPNESSENGTTDEETGVCHKRNVVVARSSSLKNLDCSPNQPSTCDICLMDLEVNDEICWSPNDKCLHCFHKECMVNWLMRNPQCPVCRRDYLDTNEQKDS